MFNNFHKIFLKDKDSANNGRKIIVHILNNWERIPIETHEMWTDLIEVAGFYPYLEKEKKNIKFSNLSGEIRKELHFANELINDNFIVIFFFAFKLGKRADSDYVTVTSHYWNSF